MNLLFLLDLPTRCLSWHWQPPKNSVLHILPCHTEKLSNSFIVNECLYISLDVRWTPIDIGQWWSTYSILSKEMSLTFISKIESTEIYRKHTWTIDIDRIHVFDFAAVLSVEFLRTLFSPYLNMTSSPEINFWSSLSMTTFVNFIWITHSMSDITDETVVVECNAWCQILFLCIQLNTK